MRSMQAIVVEQFGDPDVLRIKEVPDPKPTAAQVLVRLKAVGVNPYETYQRAGKYAVLPKLPYTPGADAAGVVEMTGPDAKRFNVGERVYTTGTITGAYAEMALCDEMSLYPLPNRITFSQGAALNVPYGTAYRGLFDRGDAKPGEIVLVHGASGGVGTAAVQLAASHGCVVFGTGGSEKGREMVRQNGAKQVFDHTSGNYLDQIMQATDGKGVNVILEMLANVNLDKDLGLLAKGGRVVVIGSRGRVEIDARQTFVKESAILGMTYRGRGEEGVHEAHSQIVAGLQNGSLNPVVNAEMPLADAAKAHRTITEGKAHGKIVLLP
jgi:NADPH:quinone reductase